VKAGSFITRVEVGSETRTSFGTGAWGLSVLPPTAVGALLVFVGYYLGAKLGFALKFQGLSASVLWSPNSILLAALLLSSYRMWPVLIFSALPAHLLIELHAGMPLGMVLCFFISNVSEAMIGATATRWLAGGNARFNTLRNMGILFLGAGLIAPFFSSFLDAAFAHWNTGGRQSYWWVWKNRFPSNVFTEVIIVPAIVTWMAPFQFVKGIGKLRYLEAAAMWAGLIVSSAAVFYRQTAGPGSNPTLLCAPIPFLVWAAVRFGPTGGSAAMLWVALQAIWGAVHGRGPFHFDSPQQNTFFIQVFFTAASCTLMFLASSVSERQQAEERFSKAFGSSPDAMILTRLADGHIIEVSEKWQELLGYDREETIGRSVLDLHIYRSEAERTALAARAAKYGELHDVEATFRAKSGEFRNVLISASTEEINRENCLIVTIRDITDRRRAEEAERKLTHASRLAMAGELTAMVAHEVKQPLGAILSNAETAEILLESENPPLNELRQIIKDIRDNDLRADGAVRRISLLLRKRELKIEPLDVHGLIDDMLHLTASDAVRRRVSIHFENNGPLPPAMGDSMHLQQVLLNLILNGMDACEKQPDGRRRITITAKEAGHEVRLSVADSAGGIPPDKMPRIFDSFFTTKEDGMGLGLAIARSIIDAHHGRIWAENNADGGATVHFTVQSAKSTEQ
jgi:two-component system sensor kinase FixL